MCNEYRGYKECDYVIESSFKGCGKLVCQNCMKLRTSHDELQGYACVNCEEALDKAKEGNGCCNLMLACALCCCLVIGDIAWEIFRRNLSDTFTLD